MTATSTTTILPPAGRWALDPSHSSVEFQVRHMMVSKVRGSFERFTADILIGETPETSSVTATVDLSSVNTGDAKRDEHLRSPDFFGGHDEPSMTFVSTSVDSDGDRYVLAGDLTINGITRPVTLDLDFNGVAADPWGGTRAGFSAGGEISRKEFGLEWNVALETGGVLVGDKVRIELEIQASLQT